MRKSMKTLAIAASAVTMVACANTASGQDDAASTEADAADQAAESGEVTVDSYIAGCNEFLGGLTADTEFSPETPTVMRYSMSLEPGADAQALWEAGVGGPLAGLVEHGQGFQEGDVESQRDRLDEGAARFLVWPDHPPMYVYAAKRVGDADAANAINANVCELGRKGLYLQTVSSFTILSEYIATEEQ